MATIAELEAKIKKAKANSMMPENLKKQYIAKIEKELAAMQSKPVKSETKKTATKSGHTVRPDGSIKTAAKSPTTDDDYDCDKIIAEAKARKEKQKKASKKADKTPTITKDETAIEKIGDRIKKHYKEGELSKKQITLLIRELTAQINELKKLLETAK